MDKNYPEITRQISANMRKLRSDIPETMKGFAAHSLRRPRTTARSTRRRRS